MVSKKKRKSAAPAEEQPAKRAGSQQGRRSGGGGSSSPLAWSADGVRVTLPSDQALLFLGRARLEVKSGELVVFGSLVTAASGSIELNADERCSGPLVLQPGAALGSVPLAAASEIVFTLTRSSSSSSSSSAASSRGAGSGGLPATPLPRQAQSQQEGGAEASSGGRRHLGFEVFLANEPGAPAALPPLPPLWQQTVAEVEETLAQQAQQAQQAAVIVVCGAKKVGKSTFARFLLNSLLNRHPVVAYLDTDCGQPEFTAPGLVSLTLVQQPVLGPPHMHQQRPAAAFFVGDTSPANDPVRYLQYIRELYRWYCQHAADAAAVATATAGAAGGAVEAQAQQLPPLVVNTHGWVKGMGLDVLVELLQGLPVSHLIQVSADNPRKNLPPGVFWLPQPPPQLAPDGSGLAAAPQQPEPAQWLLPGLGGDQQQQQQPALSETSARSAATAAASELTAAGAGGGGGKGRIHAVEQRALQWEALAQQCIDSCGLAAAPGVGGKGAAAAGQGQAVDLGDRLAAAVPYEIDAGDIQVQVLHSSIPASQMFYALNGAVVGLCTAPHPAAAAADDGAPPQPSPPLPCLGLGIVRAVDAKKRRLYILTSVPESELEGVAVLQLGRLELPASLLQTAAYMSPYLCLFSMSSMGTGAGAIKSRNNLMRQSQM